jgi:hypothetical protein
LSRASRDHLLTYLADLVGHLERFAVTLMPPNDRDDISLGQEADGSLVIDLEGRLPVARRSKPVDLTIFERWRPMGRDEWLLDEYSYELRDHELDFRRALHRHDVEAFVRSYGRATHEHCETTIGVVDCDHYAGDPVEDAFDAFERLYGLWVTGERPDCSALTCLG